MWAFASPPPCRLHQWLDVSPYQTLLQIGKLCGSQRSNVRSAIMGAGLGKYVALMTDGRFSGGSHGFIIGHVSPEADHADPRSRDG